MTVTKAKYGSTRDAVASFFLSNTGETFTSAEIASEVGSVTKTVRNVLCMLVNEDAVRKTKAGYKSRNARTLRSITA